MENSVLRDMYLDIFQGEYEKYTTEIEKSNFEEMSVPMLLGMYYILISEAHTIRNLYYKKLKLGYANQIFDILSKRNLSLEEQSIFEEFQLFYNVYFNDYEEIKFDELISKFPYLGFSRIRRIKNFRDSKDFNNALLEISIIKNYYPNLEFLDFLESDILVEKNEYGKALDLIYNRKQNYLSKVFKLYLIPFSKDKKKYFVFLLEIFIFIADYYLFKIHIMLGFLLLLLILYVLERIYKYYKLKTIILYIQLFARKSVFSLIIIYLLDNLIEKIV